MKCTVAPLMIVFGAALVCSCDTESLADAGRDDKLQVALDSVVADYAAIVNVSAAVRIGEDGYSWRGGAGLANPGDGEAMTGEHLVRTASVAKAFAAATALRMVEEGKLSLEQPVAAVLDDGDLPDGIGVADLHVSDGVKNGDKLTIRHLMSHTSGIPDQHFAESPVDGESLAGHYVAMLADGDTSDVPDRIWTRDELVKRFFEYRLNTVPLFPVGEGYQYSDTNYLLLSLVLEKLSGKTMAALYEEYLFSPIGLERTIVETAGPIPIDGRLAHHFWLIDSDNGINVDLQPLKGLASLDFGSPASGGIVSTPDNLAKFIESISTDGFFALDETNDLMRMPSLNSLVQGSEASFHQGYGLGIARIGLPSGRQLYGHCGFWGVCIAYWPESEVSLAVALNQVAALGDAMPELMDRLLDVIVAEGR